MKRALVTALTLSTCLLCGCAKDKEGPSATNGEPKPNKPAATITGIRWDERKDDGTGTLYVLLTDSSERLVESGAINSWFSNDRMTLYYSYRHGKSGYEREGEGIKRFTLSNGKSEVVFDHDLMVLSVLEAESAKGRIALIVDTIDGGRGAPEAVVADPDRGRVLDLSMAQFQKIENGVLTLGIYTDEQIDNSEFGQWPKPERTQTFDLDELLGREASRDTPNPLPID